MRWETNPQKLAALCHGNCRKSEAEIAKALQSNGRKDYLFALRQELDTYDHLQKNIEQCDVEIGKKLEQIINSDDKKVSGGKVLSSKVPISQRHSVSL